MQFIDTHAHLYMENLQKELPLIVERAVSKGITPICMPNIDETTIDSMMAITEQYPTQCLPMIGIHPCHITPNFTQQLYPVEAWLAKGKFIAVGEIGIDLYRSTALLQEQEEVFSIQLQLAKHYQLPVVIHARNSFKQVVQLLEKIQDGNLQGVIHCFTGTPAEAARYLALGFFLGVGGMLTLDKGNLASTIATIDLCHILLETDSPYLAPIPYRGQRNEPSYLLYIAKALAAIKRSSLAEVAMATTQNAIRLFKILNLGAL